MVVGASSSALGIAAVSRSDSATALRRIAPAGFCCVWESMARPSERFARASILPALGPAAARAGWRRSFHEQVAKRSPGLPGQGQPRRARPHRRLRPTSRQRYRACSDRWPWVPG